MPAWVWVVAAAGVLFVAWVVWGRGWLAGWRYDWARARHLIQQTRAESVPTPEYGSMIWDEERKIITADLADLRWGPGITAEVHRWLPAPPELAHVRLPDQETRELMLAGLAPEALGSGVPPDAITAGYDEHDLSDSGPGGFPPLTPGPAQAPIRGVAQGRAGGCAPQESRPAARAVLTGSLTPRPPREDPGSLAHGGPGPIDVSAEVAAVIIGALEPSRLADTGDVMDARLLADVAADMRRREESCRLYSAAFRLECARARLVLSAPLT